MQISINNISINRSDRAILSDISLELPLKRWIALLGPNGAGKTTLLRCAAGLLPPSSGNVTLAELPLSSLTRQQISSHIGYVPQRVGDLPSFTVQEFLNLSQAGDTLQNQEAVEEILAGVDLKWCLPTLSGGELQRVMVAGALFQSASVLLLDEPTNNLDPRAVEIVERTLSTVRQKASVSAIIVTHDINFAVRNVDEVALMKEGKIIWHGAPGDGGFLQAATEAYQVRLDRLTDNKGGAFYLPKREY